MKTMTLASTLRYASYVVVGLNGLLVSGLYYLFIIISNNKNFSYLYRVNSFTAISD